MRPALALALTACFARQPEPQGPRVVCNGVMVPAGAAYVASSNCQEIPADRCWNDESPECEAEAEQRREANSAAARREHIALGVILTIAVVVVVAIAVTR